MSQKRVPTINLVELNKDTEYIAVIDESSISKEAAAQLLDKNNNIQFVILIKGGLDSIDFRVLEDFHKELTEYIINKKKLMSHNQINKKGAL